MLASLGPCLGLWEHIMTLDFPALGWVSVDAKKVVEQVMPRILQLFHTIFDFHSRGA